MCRNLTVRWSTSGFFFGELIREKQDGYYVERSSVVNAFSCKCSHTKFIQYYLISHYTLFSSGVFHDHFTYLCDSVGCSQVSIHFLRPFLTNPSVKPHSPFFSGRETPIASLLPESVLLWNYRHYHDRLCRSAAGVTSTSPNSVLSTPRRQWRRHQGPSRRHSEQQYQR
jgi:hypothetical protein